MAMYGMNQAYNVVDPSAQVPNHLVSAPTDAPGVLYLHTKNL
jgi:hypothetical protein